MVTVPAVPLAQLLGWWAFRPSCLRCHPVILAIAFRCICLFRHECLNWCTPSDPPAVLRSGPRERAHERGHKINHLKIKRSIASGRARYGLRYVYALSYGIIALRVSSQCELPNWAAGWRHEFSSAATTSMST